MKRHATLEVPASGGKVEIVFPDSVPGRPPTTLTFDIPAPGGTVVRPLYVRRHLRRQTNSEDKLDTKCSTNDTRQRVEFSAYELFSTDASPNVVLLQSAVCIALLVHSFF